MAKISDVVDVEHPVWIEFCETVKVPAPYPELKYGREQWYAYLKYFTRDQMMLFIETFPNAINFFGKIIDHILEYKDANENIKQFESLIEGWGCTYDKFEEYDCIAKCLDLTVTSFSRFRVRKLIEYLLQLGLVFQKHHISRALAFGENMIQLMLDNGVDSNDIVATFCQILSSKFPIHFKNLKFLSQIGVDLIGHIQETN
jgi:hypothetical protein